MSLFKTGRINLKVTLVHKSYREHYILFGKQYVPGYLSELIKHMKERLKRYESPILDHFNESFTGECWMGRISWIDKDGDEILLVDERGYEAYIDAMRDGEMGTIIVRLASTKPEPDETLKQKPISLWQEQKRRGQGEAWGTGEYWPRAGNYAYPDNSYPDRLVPGCYTAPLLAE